VFFCLARVYPVVKFTKTKRKYSETTKGISETPPTEPINIFIKKYSPTRFIYFSFSNSQNTADTTPKEQEEGDIQSRLNVNTIQPPPLRKPRYIHFQEIPYVNEPRIIVRIPRSSFLEKPRKTKKPRMKKTFLVLLFLSGSLIFPLKQVNYC